jgi:hypothetical protein
MPGFAAASQQIVGKVERHPGTPTAFGQNQKRFASAVSSQQSAVSSQHQIPLA